MIGQDILLDPEHANVQVSYENVGTSSFNITRREILTLTSVLNQIPQAYVVGGEVGPDQLLTQTIVDAIERPPVLATPSQEDTGTQPQSDANPGISQTEDPISSGKRRRPRYSLTGTMLKKHPILKFSATGPIDKDKTRTIKGAGFEN